MKKAIIDAAQRQIVFLILFGVGVVFFAAFITYAAKVSFFEASV